MSTRTLTGACLMVMLLPAVGFAADGRLAEAAEHGDQALVRAAASSAAPM